MRECEGIGKTHSAVIDKTESLDEPEWKPVSTNDIPVKVRPRRSDLPDC